MAHLEHLFAAGLRFDTDIQHLTRHGEALVYQSLPIYQSESAQTCALTSPTQCIAVLEQLPLREAWELSRAAQRMLTQHHPHSEEAMPGELAADSLLALMKALCTACAEVHLAGSD